MSPSDIGHTALNVAGMIPVIGAPADAVNAGWYAAQGDWANAALSAATAIPIVGDLAGGAKLGETALKMVEDGAKVGRAVEDGAKAGRTAEDAAKAGRAVEDGAKGARSAEDAAKTERTVGDGAKTGRPAEDATKTGRTSKGSTEAAATTKGRLKAAGLPSSGRIRYVPPEGYSASMPLPRGPKGGYMDRFRNEWVKGPSRTAGQPYEWDVQLSRSGKSQLGWLSRDGSHLNVSLDGRITHR
jgi:filamentous hemagglutinin